MDTAERWNPLEGFLELEPGPTAETLVTDTAQVLPLSGGKGSCTPAAMPALGDGNERGISMLRGGLHTQEFGVRFK